jgi:hypothetical protein
MEITAYQFSYSAFINQPPDEISAYINIVIMVLAGALGLFQAFKSEAKVNEDAA